MAATTPSIRCVLLALSGLMLPAGSSRTATAPIIERRIGLQRECERAKAQPSYQNTFRRLHLNQRTSQDVRWLSLEAWDACKQNLVTLENRDCYAGLDLSTTTDLSAFVLVFPGSPMWVLPFFWIPEAKLRETRDRQPYELWQRQGLITVTPGDVVDYDAIRADIVKIGQRFSVREIRADPWNATQICGQLSEQDGFQVTFVRQGFQSLSAPSKELERQIVGRTLAHDGNPILRSMIGAVAVRLDPAGNIKPDKAKSTQRIDGVVAAILGVSGVLAGTNAPSVYASRGLIAL